MRPVTRAEFFAAIGPRDVHPRIEGNWPYTSRFLTRAGRVEVGRIVDTIPQGSAFPVSAYFLNDGGAQ